MTGRIILGVVLALILLFLFSNVRLVFRYDNGEVFLQARWLFIRYQILPEPEKRKKKGAGDEKKESTNGPPAGQGSVNGEWREGVLMQDEIFDAFADPLLSKVYFSPFFALLPLLPHLFGLCLYSNRTVWSN